VVAARRAARAETIRAGGGGVCVEVGAELGGGGGSKG